MTTDDHRKRVDVTDGDRPVATAEVVTSPELEGTARVSLRAEAGHITPGSREKLVDEVLDLPEVAASSRLEASMPLGDGESLERLRERCDDVSTRPAGSTALLDASLPDGTAGAPDLGPGGAQDSAGPPPSE
jgi:hypothetical protein